MVVHARLKRYLVLLWLLTFAIGAIGGLLVGIATTAEALRDHASEHAAALTALQGLVLFLMTIVVGAIYARGAESHAIPSTAVLFVVFSLTALPINLLIGSQRFDQWFISSVVMTLAGVSIPVLMLGIHRAREKIAIKLSEIKSARNGANRSVVTHARARASQ